MQKKSRIIELFGKQLFLSLQTNPQKVKILLMRVIKGFLMKKKKTFFSDVVSNLDIPNPSNYFKEEKFHSLSAITEHFEKHPSVTSIKNKNFESTFSLKKTPLKK